MTDKENTANYKGTPEDPPAIDFANDYLNIFDSLSTRLKRGYSRTSIWVIVITFLTSVLAVLSPLLNGSFMSDELIQILQTAIKALLIALPFIAVALLDYSREFNTSTAWIYFREAAELIRSNTHLFSLKAGKYKEHDNDFDRQHALVDEVKSIYEMHKQFDMVDISSKNKKRTRFGTVTAFILGLPDLMIDTSAKMFESMAIAETKSPRKLPQDANKFDEYINERLEYQLTWYDRRIKGDYKKLRYSRGAIIVITAITGIVAAFATDVSIVFVAVLSSLATTINLISDTLMYGATYAIYDDAMRKLKVIKTDWLIQKQENGGTMTNDASVKLVEDVEAVLMEELERWKQGMIKKVESSERAVLKNLNEGKASNVDENTSNSSNGRVPQNGQNSASEKADETATTAAG